MKQPQLQPQMNTDEHRSKAKMKRLTEAEKLAVRSLVRTGIRLRQAGEMPMATVYLAAVRDMCFFLPHWRASVKSQSRFDALMRRVDLGKAA